MKKKLYLFVLILLFSTKSFAQSSALPDFISCAPYNYGDYVAMLQLIGTFPGGGAATQLAQDIIDGVNNGTILTYKQLEQEILIAFRTMNVSAPPFQGSKPKWVYGVGKITLCPTGNVGLGGLQNPKAPLHVWGNAFFQGGYVGIGTTVPSSPLHVYGDAVIQKGMLGVNTTTPAYTLDVNGDGNIHSLKATYLTSTVAKAADVAANFQMAKQHIFIVPRVEGYQYNPSVTPGDEAILFSDGAAGGSQNASSGLYIGPHSGTAAGIRIGGDGTLESHAIKVVGGNAFPDYVFEKDYSLMDLKELEVFLNDNKHLPGIPSAKEVEQNNGVELGEMNKQLLKKVEELTLYIIDQNKRIEALETKKQ